ncbi:hypothetical protein EBR96_00135, partial [bacterium]|nr:hypothetical protein [bacterium]
IVWKSPTDSTQILAELIPIASVAARYRVPVAIKVPVAKTDTDLRIWLEAYREIAEGSSATLILQQLPVFSHVWGDDALAILDNAPARGAVLYTFSPYTGEVASAVTSSFPLSELIKRQRRILNFETGDPVNPRLGWPNRLILFLNSQGFLEKAARDSISLITADADFETEMMQPRGAGTYARIIRRWIMDAKAMKWVDFVGLVCHRPAQRLGTAVPALRNKGKIAVGADADIVLIDPSKIEDWATYQYPYQASQGISDVIVNGIWVLHEGKILNRTAGKFLEGRKNVSDQ